MTGILFKQRHAGAGICLSSCCDDWRECVPLILWPEHGTPSLPEVPCDGIEEKPLMTRMGVA